MLLNIIWPQIRGKIQRLHQSPLEENTETSRLMTLKLTIPYHNVGMTLRCMIASSLRHVMSDRDLFGCACDDVDNDAINGPLQKTVVSITLMDAT